jgi:hypothetical protein
VYKSVVAEHEDLAKAYVEPEHVDDLPMTTTPGAKQGAGEEPESKAVAQRSSLGAASSRPAPDGRPGSSGSQPAAAAAAAAPPKKQSPWRKEFYTADQAKALLPQVVGCMISLVGNRQWQVKYLHRKRRPLSHTRTYDAEGETALQAHLHALQACVAWAWAAHNELHPQAAPPFDVHEQLF